MLRTLRLTGFLYVMCKTTFVTLSVKGQALSKHEQVA
jgi:hypothetical protein